MSLFDIAIVGLSCRLPGANSADEYWRNLQDGKDAISNIPNDRWDQSHFNHPTRGTAGKSYSFSAGILDDIKGFDAQFFGISPREAEQMDPQQRLLLEVTYEALEDAGQLPKELSSSNCAVMIGISATDYATARQGDPAGGNAYSMLGSTLSIAANRISYIYDLKGPSMAVDTACSSSLVAINEALNMLWDGRADMAVAGGVNLLISPYSFVGFSSAAMLSKDGRCKAFSKDADGFVRGEGAGIFVLKPLSDAIRDGDPVHAVITGAGVNSDGRSNSIAMPSTASQQELLETVMAKFSIDPAEIDYFEAHGTGTSVGDPIELCAIGQAIGQKQKTTGPLAVGSAKSNIGHLEPASGVAGLVKAVQILKHKKIPPTLHCTELNPDIDFEGLNVLPARATIDLSDRERPLQAGVNSFGFGGTNATVFLREYIEPPALHEENQDADASEKLVPLILSARSEQALKARAGQFARFLSDVSDEAFYDIAYMAAFRRECHDYRAVFWGKSVAAITEKLSAFSNDEEVEVHSGKLSAGTAKTGFIFSGNGAQWPGMGRQLYMENSIFREAVDEVDHLLIDMAGWSVRELLLAEDSELELQKTEIAQPALFAIQVGICRCLEGLGIRADAVSGHSVGEVAAAYIAGIFDLGEAVRLILCRSDIQGRTRGMGKMMALSLPPESAPELIENYGGRFELAAVNSSAAITLCGEEAALVQLRDDLADSALVKILDLDYAFHSAVLDPLKEAFDKSAGTLSPAGGALPFYSTVSGDLTNGADLDTDYWWRNARMPVQFQSAVESMVEDGCSVFIEIGPQAVLQSYLRRNMRQMNVDGVVLATLGRQRQGYSALEEVADMVFVSGGNCDMSKWFPRVGQNVPLPSYPWQKEPFWYPQTIEAQGPIYLRSEGRFLGTRTGPGLTIWECLVDAEIFPFLKDHQIGGNVLFPATGFMEIALEASRALFSGECHEIEGFEIRHPLMLEAGASYVMRFDYDPDDKAFKIESRRYLKDVPWTLNVAGRLAAAAFHEGPTEKPGLAPEGAQHVDAATHYELTRALGLEYGPAFQCLDAMEVSGNMGWVRMRANVDLTADDNFVIHPAMFDACLQGLLAVVALQETAGESTVYVPVQMSRFKLYSQSSDIAGCKLQLDRRGPRSLIASFTLFDDAAQIVAEVEGVRFLKADNLIKKPQPTLVYRFEDRPSLEIGPDDTMPPMSSMSLPRQVQTSTGPDLNGLARRFFGDAFSGHINDDKVSSAGWRKYLTERMLAGDDASSPLDPLEQWRQNLKRHPDAIAELLCIGSAGSALSGALCSGQMVFAPQRALMEHLMQASPGFTQGREAVLQGMKQIAQGWPSTRRLRILDLSALSNLVQPFLHDCGSLQIDYLVASGDKEALARIYQAPGGLSELKTNALDFSGILGARDLEEVGSFDLVVCAGANLDTRLTSALFSNLDKVLRPGGLFLISQLKPQPWLDLVFGGHDNWWTSDGQPVLKQSQALQDTLEAEKFLNIEIVEDDDQIVLRSQKSDRETGARSRKISDTDNEQLWLFVLPRSGAASTFGLQIAGTMESLGHIAVNAWSGTDLGDDEDVLFLDVDDRDSWREILSMFETAPKPLKGVVLLSERDDDGWALCQAAAAMAGLEAGQMPGLQHVVVGTANDEVAADAFGLASGAALGAARVIRNEYSALKCGTLQVCIPGEESGLLVQSAVRSLLSAVEPEVSLSRAGMSTPRLLEQSLFVDQALQGTARKLDFTPGKLDALKWIPSSISTPADDQIVVETRATGLNFRDVMFALGVLPEEALENGFVGPTIGLEAAGVVSAVGAAVTDFNIGDDVICYAPACFSSHILCDVRAVMKKPAQMSHEQAATIPTVFLTVYYALAQLARLEAGERVLIHGAAGGVGLAALQYAQHVKAEIYVTVGSEEKRSLMRLMGVAEERILDSRSLEFADQIMILTEGEGIDVVLNSLAGDAIHRNLEILRPFGRFLELGKRDFYENSRIGLKFFRNNLTYFGIDLDQLMVERPVLCQRMFNDVIALFDEGVFTALPYRVFDSHQVAESFRYLQQSRHIGKIVVRPPLVTVDQSLRAGSEKLSLDPKGVYLVTGGTSGFGLKTASFLADKGAGALILVSRGGLASDDGTAAVAAMEARGTKVYAAACDVNDEAGLQTLIAAAQEEGYRLKGIIHAAALFDDGLIASLDRAQYDRVLAPKVSGGEVLDNISLAHELDFFVLYSSITTAFGNPGQANYVAANSSLEALAARRHAKDLPALAIGWGPIADAGYLVRNEDVKESLEAGLGSEAMTSVEALGWLEQLLLRREQDVLYVASVNWSRLSRVMPALRSPVFAHLIGDNSDAGDENIDDMLLKIRQMDKLEALAFIDGLVAAEFGKVLGLNSDRLDRNKSMFDLGMDSLMAMELSLGIEERMRVDIPALLLSQSSSMAELTMRIYTHLAQEEEADVTEEQFNRLADKHMDETVDLHPGNNRKTA